MNTVKFAAMVANLLLAFALAVIGLLNASGGPSGNLKLLTGGGCFLLGIGIVVALMNVVILTAEHE